MKLLAICFLALPDRLGLDAPLARLGDQVYRLGMRKKETHHLVIQGVQAMLAGLQAHYPLAVVSARGERNTLDFLTALRLARLFRADCYRANLPLYQAISGSNSVGCARYGGGAGERPDGRRYHG